MDWPHSGCSVSTCGFGNCEGHEPRTSYSGENAAGCCCRGHPGLAGTILVVSHVVWNTQQGLYRGLNLNSCDNRQICGRCMMAVEEDTCLPPETGSRGVHTPASRSRQQRWTHMPASGSRRWRTLMQHGPCPVIIFLLLDTFVSLLKFFGLQLFSFSNVMILPFCPDPGIVRRWRCLVKI